MVNVSIRTSDERIVNQDFKRQYWNYGFYMSCLSEHWNRCKQGYFRVIKSFLCVRQRRYLWNRTEDKIKLIDLGISVNYYKELKKKRHARSDTKITFY